MHRRIDIDSLKESINIVDIVSKYTDLRKTGHKTYTGLCPNPEHNDSNDGNFYVREDKQFYKCFVCGDFKGDVISFIEEMEGIDFLKAVELLIDAGGLDYEDIQTTTTFIKEDFDITKLRKAIDLYNEENTIDEGKLDKYRIKHHYLLDRGFKEKTLKYFEIGYCGDVNDRYYDRVLIPWRDTKGKLIGINGRAVNGQTPKYKYSKGRKKKVLFNIHNLEPSNDPIILTEGELDTIRLHELGYPRAVALGGSDLGDRKWLLKKYTNHVILALDLDEGGLRARKNIVQQLYPLMNVSAIKLPEDKDIADIKNKKIIQRFLENKKMFEGGY